MPRIPDLASRGDLGLALAYGGDEALLCDGGDGLVRGGPGQFACLSVPRIPLDLKALALALRHGKLIRGKLEALLRIHADGEQVGRLVGRNEQGRLAAGAVGADLCALAGGKVDLVGHADIDVGVACSRLAVCIPVHRVGVVIIAHGLDDIAAGVVGVVYEIGRADVGAHAVALEAVELTGGRNAVKLAFRRAAEGQDLTVGAGDVGDLLKGDVAVGVEADLEESVASVILAVAVAVAFIVPADSVEVVADRIRIALALVRIVECHVVQDLEAAVADLAGLSDEGLRTPVGVVRGNKHDRAVRCALGHEVAVDVLCRIIAVRAVERLVAVVAHVCLVGAEPAAFNGSAVKRLAAIQAVGAQLLHGRLLIGHCAEVEGDIDFRLIAGVVCHNDGEVGAEAGDVIVLGKGLARLILDFVLAHNDAVVVDEDQGRDVLVVVELQRKKDLAVLDLEILLEGRLILHNGSLVVQRDIKGEGIVHHVVAVIEPCTGSVGDGRAVGQLVVVLVKAGPDLVFLCQNIQRDDLAVAGVIVGLCHILAGQVEVDLVRDLILNLEVDLLQVAEQADVDLGKRVGIGEGIVLVAGSAGTDVRVRADGGIVRENAERIQAGFVFVSRVERRSLRPVAVEAEERHLEVGRVIRGGLHIKEAFDIHAVLEGCVEIGLVFRGQRDGGSQGDGLASRNGDALKRFRAGNNGILRQIGADLQLCAVGRDDIDIVLVDGAVAIDVQIGIVHIVLSDGSIIGDVQQQDAGVGRRDLAVVIEVILHDVRLGRTGHGQGSAQRIGSVADERAVGVGHDSFGENGGIERIGQILLTGHVVDSERERVDTVFGVVVAQLRLGAVLISLRVGQIGKGACCLDKVGKTGALASRGDLEAAGIEDGIRRAHQEVRSDLTELCFLILRIVLAQILHENSHRAGDLRGRHGRTAHKAVVGACNARITGGVDVAADTGDLRLQLQVRGDAPGGEVAEGAVALDLHEVAVAACQGLDALGELRLHVLAVCLGDKDCGDVIAAVIDLHVEHAGGIVVDHDADRTCSLCSGLLVGEGAGAAGNQGDLTADIHILIVARLAVAADRNEFHRLALEVAQELRGVRRCGVVVADGAAVHGEVQGFCAVVVDGGNGQSGRKRTRGTDDAVIGVAGTGEIPSGAVLICSVRFVARSDQDLDIGALEQLKRFAHVAGRKAAGCTKGEVAGIDIQTDAVLKTGHDGVPAGAAARGEDLHDDDLGIRRNTDDTAAFDLISSRDTGDMRAVVMLCRCVRYIEITRVVVEDERKLAIIIGAIAQARHLARIQRVPDGIDAFLRQGALGELILGQSAEVRMIDHDAGVQNGDLHALAGEARCIELIGADHGGGVAGHGLQLAVRRQGGLLLGQGERRGDVDMIHTGKRLEGFLIAVLRLYGHAGRSDGVGVTQLELCVIAELLREVCLERIELETERSLIGNSLRRAGGDVVLREACHEQRALLHDDDERNNLVRLGLALGKLCGEAVFAVLHELRLTSLNGLLRVGLDSRVFSDIAARELHRAVRGDLRDVAVCKAALRGKGHGNARQNKCQRKEQRQDPFLHCGSSLSQCCTSVAYRTMTVAT